MKQLLRLVWGGGGSFLSSDWVRLAGTRQEVLLWGGGRRTGWPCEYVSGGGEDERSGG